jgi:hypothetical protein
MTIARLFAEIDEMTATAAWAVILVISWPAWDRAIERG